MGGGRDYHDCLDYHDRLIEYNPSSNTWRVMPSLQDKRWIRDYSVCSLDNKIFVLGGYGGGDDTCEMLDLSDDDPQWRFIADMDSEHYSGGAVVLERRIYLIGGKNTSVEVYDVDQSILI